MIILMKEELHGEIYQICHHLLEQRFLKVTMKQLRKQMEGKRKQQMRKVRNCHFSSFGNIMLKRCEEYYFKDINISNMNNFIRQN